ncbi:signal recognition particle receptor FtsY [Saccharopolyspora subtropica]|uniref:Signal recognition particle receptor FtsY n=1 Tax=Saccharopolyspora thermophila TaxID=89367 RepID=A0A917JK25_9PSEU|nr:signal recognition particle-docking protein FtsY [Saccharopolyspora subtropica]GGI73816.1 signal recognition particle receptor FtsY [Saccharopolyspora subtropica]
MTTSTLILILVVVAVVLAVAVVAGVVLNRRRRINLSERDESAGPAGAVKGGGYRADGGISLSSGGVTTVAPPEHPAGERTEVEGQPGVGDDAAVPRDSERRGIVDVPLPDNPTATAPVEEPVEKPVEEPVVPPQERVEPVPEPAPAEPAVPEIEEIQPTTGRLERLRGRLSRSRSTLGQSLLGLLGAGDLDEDSWEEIEDTLLMADLGAATTTEITERLRTEIASRGVRTPEQARALLREVLVDALGPDMERAVRALPHGDPANGGKPAVVLVVGVNGTGKTTTTGKLARVLVADGRRVLLGAADTFRAAAVEQLATWGDRVGAEVVRGKEGADPASVAFEAVSRGTETAVDAVLVDTAGRLHTKTGLMDELGKVKRVVDKKAQVDEVLLVLDATTGQNGLTQARVFSDVVDVTGIVLTKLDGTAKGGIVFQVQRELGVPVKLVGLGEGPDDLAPFEPGAFVDALLD